MVVAVPLPPRAPDLASLDLLLSVARTGSLGAAAREHGITQQAASERVRRLEGLMGVELLHRSRRGSALTTAGALVADWASQLTELAAGLTASVDALRVERNANLRVAASQTVSEYLIPRWLVTLRRRHADLSVQLTATNSEEVEQLVRSGHADVGFVEGPRPPDDLSWRAIGTDALVLVVPPGHAWARRRRGVTPSELAATPLVSREAGSGTRRSLEVALKAVIGDGVEFAQPALEMSGTAAVRGAVSAGAGPAVLSRLAVVDDLRSGRLRAVPLAGVSLTRRFLAVWPRGGALRGPAAELLAITAPR
jgi:molybdate transport repressor ModE-like protein